MSRIYKITPLSWKLLQDNDWYFWTANSCLGVFQITFNSRATQDFQLNLPDGKVFNFSSFDDAASNAKTYYESKLKKYLTPGILDLDEIVEKLKKVIAGFKWRREHSSFWSDDDRFHLTACEFILKKLNNE